MKKIVMVLSLLTMVACKEQVVYITGPTLTKTDTLVITNGIQNVNLVVNWSKFNTTSKLMSDFMANAVSDSGLSITHVGVRLVYPKNNAAFTQSAVKDTGSTKLITLQVPATDTAHLYVLAVYAGNNGNKKALKMAVKRNISIPTGGNINLTLDSLTLMDTDWMIDTTDVNVRMLNDTIRVTRSNTFAQSYVRVHTTDPYQIGDGFISYSNRIVKFFGSGNEMGNPSGLRKFDILVLNRGTSTSMETFWPYIDGGMFNLNGDYLIGKQGVIKTTWQ